MEKLNGYIKEEDLDKQLVAKIQTERILQDEDTAAKYKLVVKNGKPYLKVVSV